MNWHSLLGLFGRDAAQQSAGRGLSAALEDRLELFSLEFQEERHRLVRMLIYGVLAASFGMTATAVLSVTIIIQFWETPWRYTAAWAVTLLWVSACATCVYMLYRLHVQREAAFLHTRQELKQDLIMLKDSP